MAIDGAAVTDAREARERLAGPPGSKVRLTFKPHAWPGEKERPERTIEVERAR